MSIEEIIKKVWLKVEEVDKKAFIVFFITMNIVFLYNSVFCLFGNEDIIVMFGEQSPSFNYFLARYAETILEYFIANKTIIPMFINIILFFLLSMGMVFLLNFFKLKKTMFNFLLAGLFFLLSPTMYPLLWYRSVCFGMILVIFFTILSFCLCEKISCCSRNKEKINYFIGALFLMTVFVFGCYQPAIGTVCGLLCAKIFVDYFENDFSNIKKVICKYKYFYIVIFCSLLIDYIIYLYLNSKGIIDNIYYPNMNMINLSEFYTYIIPFLTKTLMNVWSDTYPYIGVFYKSLLFLIFLFSFISLFLYKNQNYKNIKKTIVKVFIIAVSYFVLFYIFNLMYFLASVFYDNSRLFRCEYWTTTSFFFVLVIFSLKYSQKIIRDFVILVLFIIVFLNIQINMHVQRDQMISQTVELSRVMTLKNLILGHKDYVYSPDIKYKYLQIGNIKNSGRSEVYNSNDFNNGYVPEMISTFQLDRSFQIALVEVPPKIRNINPYSSEHINLIHQLEKYLDDDVKNWFLNEAKSYPSPDCIYISKGKIYAVLDQKFLKAIKDYLGDNS